jgi:hypothetical protein
LLYNDLNALKHEIDQYNIFFIYDAPSLFSSATLFRMFRIASAIFLIKQNKKIPYPSATDLSIADGRALERSS